MMRQSKLSLTMTKTQKRQAGDDDIEYDEQHDQNLRYTNILHE